MLSVLGRCFVLKEHLTSKSFFVARGGTTWWGRTGNEDVHWMDCPNSVLRICRRHSPSRSFRHSGCQRRCTRVHCISLWSAAKRSAWVLRGCAQRCEAWLLNSAAAMCWLDHVGKQRTVCGGRVCRAFSEVKDCSIASHKSKSCRYCWAKFSCLILCSNELTLTADCSLFTCGAAQSACGCSCLYPFVLHCRKTWLPPRWDRTLFQEVCFCWTCRVRIACK